MRHKLLALLFSALMLFSGMAMAQPPEGDPTCGAGGRSEEECPGDNGDEGCRGLQTAEEHAGEEVPGLDLAEDILGEGFDGECPDGED